MPLFNFYVDDGLMGENSVDRAIRLRKEVQCLFSLGGGGGGGVNFPIRKWMVSDSTAEKSIPPHLRDQQSSCLIKYSGNYIKVLGVE